MFLSQSEGGRRTPAMSGIKPQLELKESSTSCAVWGETTDQIFVPGVEYAVDEYKHQIIVGMAVRLREGSRLIATGVITAIL
jgi:translation elongation factor EF-Tu-like GTPase